MSNVARNLTRLRRSKRRRKFTSEFLPLPPKKPYVQPTEMATTPAGSGDGGPGDGGTGGSEGAGSDGGPSDAGQGGSGGSGGSQGNPGKRAADAMQDMSVAPAAFHGGPAEDAMSWGQTFERYVMFRGMGNKQAAHLFPLLLRDVALSWYNDTFPNAKDAEAITEVLVKFKKRFGLNESARWKHRGEVWQRRQGPNESVASFVSDMQRKAALLEMDAKELQDAVIQGFRPEIRTFVVQREPKSLGQVYNTALLAESTVESSSAQIAGQLERSVNLMKKLEARLQATSIAYSDYGDNENRSDDRSSGNPIAIRSRPWSRPRSTTGNTERRLRSFSPGPVRRSPGSDRYGQGRAPARRLGTPFGQPTFRQFNQPFNNSGWRQNNFNFNRSGGFNSSRRPFGSTNSTRRACFCCGSLSHLAKECDSRTQRTA